MERAVLKLYLKLIESGEYDEQKKYANLIQALKKQTGADNLTIEELHEIEKAWIRRMQEIGKFA